MVEQLTPTAVAFDRIGTLGRPTDLRVRGSVGWSKSAWNATLFGNYVDGYKDDASIPNKAIDPFITFDASAGTTLGRGPLKGFRVLVSAENILSAKPPFVDRTNGFGFDAANANPFGRTIALEIRRSW